MAPAAARHGLIRLVDATTVRKAGTSARENGPIVAHPCVYDLPSDGSAHLNSPTRRGRADRPGRGRAGRNPYRRPHTTAAREIANVIAPRGRCSRARRLEERSLVGGRTAKPAISSACWQATPAAASIGRSARSQPSRTAYGCGSSPSDAKAQAVKAVAEARAEARSKQRKLHPDTLVAAQWVLLVTSLGDDYTADKVLELLPAALAYRDRFQTDESLAASKDRPANVPRSPRRGCSAI